MGTIERPPNLLSEIRSIKARIAEVERKQVAAAGGWQAATIESPFSESGDGIEYLRFPSGLGLVRGSFALNLDDYMDYALVTILPTGYRPILPIYGIFGLDVGSLTLGVFGLTETGRLELYGDTSLTGSGTGHFNFTYWIG